MNKKFIFIIIGALVFILCAPFVAARRNYGGWSAGASLGFYGSQRYTVDVTTNTGVTAVGSFCVVNATGNIIIGLDAGYSISVDQAVEGDFITITTTSTEIITFVEGASQGLRLGASTRSVGQYDSLTLVLVATGTANAQKYWQETGFIAN